MKFFDKLLDVMNVSDTDEYDEYDEYDEDDEVEEEVTPKRGFFKKKEKEYDYDLEGPVVKEKKSSSKPAAKVTPITKKRTGDNSMEVCVIKPTNFEDSKEITETLLSGRAVVLNFEGLEVDLAQRVADYAAGTCAAIDGNLRKISNYIFIVTPKSVGISGDYQDLLDISGIKTDF